MHVKYLSPSCVSLADVTEKRLYHDGHTYLRAVASCENTYEHIKCVGGGDKCPCLISTFLVDDLINSGLLVS